MEVSDIIIRAAARSVLPHALLFWGPLSQAEKTAIVLKLSHRLQGLKRPLSLDEYSSRAMFDRWKKREKSDDDEKSSFLPDFMLLLPDRRKESDRDTISVEQIEQLAEEMMLYPFESANRIIYIPSAGCMTVPAQNTLLKKLEEPPANNFIIMDVAKPHLLLKTIISRCLSVYLPRAKKEPDIAFEDHLHWFSNNEDAKKLVSDISIIFENNPLNSVSALSDIRSLLAAGSTLSDREKILVLALFLKERAPQVAHDLIVFNENPQKISMDSVFYYISQAMVT
ncbi:MAG TPA: hypothetical protein P5077_11455 [bacterium]|nr:hypothetical protein [bacterium]